MDFIFVTKNNGRTTAEPYDEANGCHRIIAALTVEHPEKLHLSDDDFSKRVSSNPDEENPGVEKFTAKLHELFYKSNSGRLRLLEMLEQAKTIRYVMMRSVEGQKEYIVHEIPLVWSINDTACVCEVHARGRQHFSKVVELVIYASLFKKAKQNLNDVETKERIDNALLMVNYCTRVYFNSSWGDDSEIAEAEEQFRLIHEIIDFTR
jgi:hypothetical protein